MHVMQRRCCAPSRIRSKLKVAKTGKEWGDPEAARKVPDADGNVVSVVTAHATEAVCEASKRRLLSPHDAVLECDQPTPSNPKNTSSSYSLYIISIHTLHT